MYYQYTGCIKKGNRTLMCPIGRSQNLTYRNNFCMRSWKDQAFKSVDGFGNSRIRSCSTVPPNVVQSRSIYTIYSVNIAPTVTHYCV